MGDARRHESPMAKGRLLLTEIRIPFVWDERQYFKRRNKGHSAQSEHAGKKYVMFCILYTECDMQSTQKIMVDSSMADVVFNELIEFHNITPDTTIFLEVFCYACSSATPAKVAASPVRQLSQKLSRSLSRAFGKRVARNPQQMPWLQHASSVHTDLNNISEEKEQQKPKPPPQIPATGLLNNFTKIAEATIHVDELVGCEDGRSYILSPKIPQRGTDRASFNAFDVPLFGSFSCRSAVQPYCATKEIGIGKILVQKANKISAGQGPKWTEYYCTLVNTYLYCYNTNRDRRLMETVIRIDQDTKVYLTKDPFGMEIVDGNATYLLRFSSADERRMFMKILLAHISEMNQWSECAFNIKELKIRPLATKNEIRRRGSLYDEIPLSTQCETI